MITVNNINISNDGLTLNVNISTGVGYNIIAAKLWTEDTFKDYSLVNNLDYKLEQINNNEIFIISATEVGLSNFSGIYFLEFETDQPEEDECDSCPKEILVVVTNLNQYYRCMTELILKAEICTDNLFSREVCDDSHVNKALSINLLIETINQSLEIGQFIEAIGLMKKIKKLCNKCTNCKKIIKSSTCNSCNTYTV